MKRLLLAIALSCLVAIEPAVVKASPTVQDQVPYIALVTMPPTSHQAGLTPQQLEDLYSAVRGVPRTPEAYIEAYMNAIASRTGLYARAYLDPSIRNQIPAETIGSSRWIVKWTITQVGKEGQEGYFHVTAYSPPVGTRSTWVKVFDAHITVKSVRTDNEFAPPFIITSQRFDWSKGWEDPRWFQ